jgi:hypothetical protein
MKFVANKMVLEQILHFSPPKDHFTIVLYSSVAAFEVFSSPNQATHDHILSL